MPKLLLIENKETVSSFDLSEGKIMIGRDEHCDIYLDDEAVSRHHVRVFTLMGDAFLEDLGSSNGTFVNGKLTQKCALNDGDVIQIGEKELRFSQPVESTSPQQGEGKVDATRIIRPGDFGPATQEAKEKNRSREGISPVSFAAKEDSPTNVRVQQEAETKQTKSGGLWGWIRRLFS